MSERTYWVSIRGPLRLLWEVYAGSQEGFSLGPVPCLAALKLRAIRGGTGGA